MPIEPAWRFYPASFAESIAKLFRWGKLYAGLRRTYVRAKHDPRRFEYMDTALTPVSDEELETLELFQTTRAVTAPPPPTPRPELRQDARV